MPAKKQQQQQPPIRQHQVELLVPLHLLVEPQLALDGTCASLEACGLVWSLVDRKSGDQLGPLRQVVIKPSAGMSGLSEALEQLEASLEGRTGLLVTYGASCLRQGLHPVAAASKLELRPLFEQYLDVGKELAELADEAPLECATCCPPANGLHLSIRPLNVAEAASRVFWARRRSDEMAKSLVRQFVGPNCNGQMVGVSVADPVGQVPSKLWEALQQVEQVLEHLASAHPEDPPPPQVSPPPQETSEPERACQLNADQAEEQPHCSCCSSNCQPDADAADGPVTCREAEPPAEALDGQVSAAEHRDQRHDRAAGDNGQPALLVDAMSRLLERLIREEHQFTCVEQIKLRVQVGLCEQSAKHHLEHKVVRARGLPWQATEQDIADFFAGLNIAKGGVGLCLSRQGRRNGEALILFESREQRDLALSRHKHFMGARYIEVYRASGDDFLGVAAAYNNKAQAFLSRGGEVIIRMRGLPFSCSARQVVDFFANDTGEGQSGGCQVLGDEEGVLFVRNHEDKPTGDAFVLFASELDSAKALAKHKHNIGARYVELFRSTISEAQQVLSISSSQPTFECPAIGSGASESTKGGLQESNVGQRSSRFKSSGRAGGQQHQQQQQQQHQPTSGARQLAGLRSYAQAVQPSSVLTDSCSSSVSSGTCGGSCEAPTSILTPNSAEELQHQHHGEPPDCRPGAGSESGSQELLAAAAANGHQHQLDRDNSPNGALSFGPPVLAAQYWAAAAAGGPPAHPHGQYGYVPAPFYHPVGPPAAPPNPYELPADPAATSRRDCVRLRGLPFEAHVEDVLQFMGDHSKHIVYQGIHMVLGPQGQASGEAIVQMASTQAAQSAARLFHHKVMSVGKKQRYIEVIPCSIDDVLFGLAAHQHHHQNNQMVAQYAAQYHHLRYVMQHYHQLQMYHHHHHHHI